MIKPAIPLVLADPAQDVVNVVLEHSTAPYKVRLVNDLGQEFAAPMVTLDGLTRIDVGSLPTGSYVVLVVTGNSVLTKRLIVAR